MGKDKKSDYTIQLEGKRGEVVIGSDVIAMITGLAVMDVEGVASMAGQTSREAMSKSDYKSLAKGVNVELLGDVVSIDISLNLKYGYNIMQVSKKIQEKIKVTVENMTGLNVADVNVTISGIDVKVKNQK